jgi:hypothetical protein
VPSGAVIRHRLVAAALTAAAAAWPTLAVTAPAAATQPAVRYVALGDSYASGLGAGGYSAGSCERSSWAYPALWAAAHHPSPMPRGPVRTRPPAR